MILTAIFTDGKKPSRVNFTSQDYFTDEERRAELDKKLKERFGEVRKHATEWRWDWK